MKKDSKVAITISSILITFAILLFIWILPFLYVWISFEIPDKNTQINYLKKAVKYSIFPVQKVYTIESIMPSLVLTGQYEQAIKYYIEYEKSDTNSLIRDAIKHLAAYAYLHTDNYAEALKIAKETNNKTLQAQVYIKIRDFETAKTIVNELLKENPERLMNYRYVAEIQMGENKWKEAEVSINKVINFAPNNIEVLKDKAEISKQLGKTNDYKKYSKKIKEIEYKRQYK